MTYHQQPNIEWVINLIHKAFDKSLAGLHLVLFLDSVAKWFIIFEPNDFGYWIATDIAKQFHHCLVISSLIVEVQDCWRISLCEKEIATKINTILFNASFD